MWKNNQTNIFVSHRKKPNGFTLLELMVVMLLITILLAVAVPRFDSGFLNNPIKKVSRWMINTCRTLRSEALGRQMAFSLIIELDDNRMWIMDDSLDEAGQEQAREKAFSPPQSIRIISVLFPDRNRETSGTVYITFHPGGYSDQALIHFETDDARRFTCIIEPLLPKVRIVEEWIDF